MIMAKDLLGPLKMARHNLSLLKTLDGELTNRKNMHK